MAGKKTPDRKPANSPKKAARQDPSDGEVGKVLKTVYQRAIEEDIPAEMLDLLSKLD